MRADMDRVVIERPRWGSWRPNREVRAQRRAWRLALARDDFDGEVTRVRMVPRTRCCGFDGKSFSDLLGPLKRFLRRRCGRPWDDVYSEIRQRLRVDSLLQKHLLDHLVGMVWRSVVIGPDGGPRAFVYGLRPVGGLFVHPVTGRLLWASDGPGREGRRPPRAIRRAPQPMLQVYARLRVRDRLWLQLASGWVVVRLRDDDGHDALFDWPAAGILRAERAAVYGDASLRAATCRPVGRRARQARGLG